jgi:transcriptional regulator with XRE-family HTH domain
MTRRDSRAALGEAVRHFRVERDETQEALAHKAGITVGHLSKIERGQANPTWETLEAVAAALEISVSRLAARAEK